MGHDTLIFEEIYSTYHERILRRLSRLVGEAETEDPVQETFLKAAKI
jgi:DNA-directed RNA polymerase specialized sigma24 family protein